MAFGTDNVTIGADGTEEGTIFTLPPFRVTTSSGTWTDLTGAGNIFDTTTGYGPGAPTDVVTFGPGGGTTPTSSTTPLQSRNVVDEIEVLYNQILAQRNAARAQQGLPPITNADATEIASIWDDVLKQQNDLWDLAQRDLDRAQAARNQLNQAGIPAVVPLPIPPELAAILNAAQLAELANRILQSPEIPTPRTPTEVAASGGNLAEIGMVGRGGTVIPTTPAAGQTGILGQITDIFNTGLNIPTSVLGGIGNIIRDPAGAVTSATTAITTAVSGTTEASGTTGTTGTVIVTPGATGGETDTGSSTPSTTDPTGTQVDISPTEARTSIFGVKVVPQTPTDFPETTPTTTTTTTVVTPTTTVTTTTVTTTDTTVDTGFNLPPVDINNTIWGLKLPTGQPTETTSGTATVVMSGVTPSGAGPVGIPELNPLNPTDTVWGLRLPNVGVGETTSSTATVVMTGVTPSGTGPFGLPTTTTSTTATSTETGFNLPPLNPTDTVWGLNLPKTDIGQTTSSTATVVMTGVTPSGTGPFGMPQQTTTSTTTTTVVTGTGETSTASTTSTIVITGTGETMRSSTTTTAVFTGTTGGNETNTSTYRNTVFTGTASGSETNTSTQTNTVFTGTAGGNETNTSTYRNTVFTNTASSTETNTSTRTNTVFTGTAGTNETNTSTYRNTVFTGTTTSNETNQTTSRSTVFTGTNTTSNTSQNTGTSSSGPSNTFNIFTLPQSSYSVMPTNPAQRNILTEGTTTSGAFTQLTPQFAQMYGGLAGGYQAADEARLYGMATQGSQFEQAQQALNRMAQQQTASANAALRAGNIGDVAGLSGIARTQMRLANPELYGALGQMTDQARQQAALDFARMQAGEQLTPEEIRNAQQAAREAYAARGLVMSPGATGAEILNRQALQQQRQQLARQNYQQSLQNLGAATQMQTANVFDPFQTVLGQQYGMQTQNVGTTQGLFGQAGALASGSLAYQPVVQTYNPFGVYPADVYGTNVNAVNAAQIAEANRDAALQAARMGQTGTYAQTIGSFFGSPTGQTMLKSIWDWFGGQSGGGGTTRTPGT